ncbi:hypothetical protein FOCC_FOCC007912 [Frankliniella occidentalis]|nr:hypothetical protein FOCC_FOCC007912 [Frankliniella occidentalis]
MWICISLLLSVFACEGPVSQSAFVPPPPPYSAHTESEPATRWIGQPAKQLCETDGLATRPSGGPPHKDAPVCSHTVVATTDTSNSCICARHQPRPSSR